MTNACIFPSSPESLVKIIQNPFMKFKFEIFIVFSSVFIIFLIFRVVFLQQKTFLVSFFSSDRFFKAKVFEFKFFCST